VRHYPIRQCLREAGLAGCVEEVGHVVFKHLFLLVIEYRIPLDPARIFVQPQLDFVASQELQLGVHAGRDIMEIYAVLRQIFDLVRVATMMRAR
jgi:hypothetical protein